MWTAAGTAPGMADLDFEIDVRSMGGPDYQVAVVGSPAGEGRAAMRLPFDDLSLQVRLQAIEIALLRSGGNRRRLASDTELAVQGFGRELFDALISGDVRSRFDASVSEARRRGRPLRVRLRFDTASIASLPWEFLFDSRTQEYVVLSAKTPMVRYIELPDAVRPLTVTPPLRILGVISSPSDLPELDGQRERLRIQDATAELQQRGLLEVTWLSNATWRDLQHALRRQRWHIVHFVGHGEFDTTTDEGAIALEDDNGRSFRLSATDLGRLLGDHDSLRLVLLNACESARGSKHDAFLEYGGDSCSTGRGRRSSHAIRDYGRGVNRVQPLLLRRGGRRSSRRRGRCRCSKVGISCDCQYVGVGNSSFIHAIARREALQVPTKSSESNRRNRGRRRWSGQ